MAEEGEGEGRLVSLAEVKALLERASKDRAELTYEQKLALEHAQRFGRLVGDKAASLIADLRKLDFVTEFYAYKVADVLPRNDADVRAIFAKAKVNLGEKEVKQVLALVENHTL